MANDYFNWPGHAGRISDGTTARGAHVNNPLDELTTGLNKLPSQAENNRGSRNYGIAGGAANAYTLTLAHVSAYYAGGQDVYLEIPATLANTGPSTLSISGLGATSIVYPDNAPLNASDLPVGTIAHLKYSATLTKWVLLSLSTAERLAAVAAKEAAEAAATAAESSETNAATSASAASGSASAAAASETNAASSANAASSSETAAAGSASAAASSATAASNSETTAGTSATNAANSATGASGSASAASTSETNAGTSATNAANSASGASTSESNAGASAAAAAAAFDSFDDVYLGAKDIAPATDNDGDPLAVGAMYFDTSDSLMKVWKGAVWENGYADFTTHETGVDVHTIAAISDIQSETLTHGDALVYDAPSGKMIPRRLAATENDIGTMGAQAAGVGIYPGDLPSGFTEMSGTTYPAADNYGNYQYSDGSVMCWVPKFYYRIASVDSPNYAAYGLNALDIASEADYADFAPYASAEAKANASGYALHRAFKDGGATKRGFFIDKYQASNNGGTASSLRYGLPLSTASDHNPINGLTGSPANNYAGTIDAAKTRGSQFSVCSRFIYSAMATLSMAHGQASTSDTYCDWYDGAGITNYPKGNNNDALGDVDDGTISYESDGYLNAGKAGSGTPFSRTTHNGQSCGVTDLNGNMWEVSLGLTRPGTSSTDAVQQNDATAFYMLKETVAIADITSGFGTGNDAWGTAVHLATLYDPITLAHISMGDGWQRFGSGANQVLSDALSGDGYRMTGLGIYKDANGESLSGTSLFGTDGLYEYHRANLCVLSGGAWATGSIAGPWAADLSSTRSDSRSNVGFRAACYFV